MYLFNAGSSRGFKEVSYPRGQKTSFSISLCARIQKESLIEPI